MIFPIKPNPTIDKAIEQMITVAHYIQAIIADIISVIALIILFPVNLEWFEPKRRSDCDLSKTPILLIHGFLGSSNNWAYHRYQLIRSKQKNVFSVNLGDPRKSIEEYANIVAIKAKTIAQYTGRADLILVGHSMGGLVAEEYLYHQKDPTTIIKKVITIGTPCLGTHVAHLASWFSKAARDMIPSSPFLKKIHADEQNDSSTIYHRIGTKTDTIIRPTLSALGTPIKNRTTTTLNGIGHIHYLFSPTTSRELVNSIPINC